MLSLCTGSHIQFDCQRCWQWNYNVMLKITVFAWSDATATHCPILCSVYSKAATNRERYLLLSVHLSLIPRPIPRFQCIRINTVQVRTKMRWLGLITNLLASSWSAVAFLQSGTYMVPPIRLFLMNATCILLTWASQATPHLQYF